MSKDIKSLFKNDNNLQKEIIKKLIKHDMGLKDVAEILGINPEDIKQTYTDCLIEIVNITQDINFAKINYYNDAMFYLSSLENMDKHGREQFHIIMETLRGQELVDALWQLGLDSIEVEFIRKLKSDNSKVHIHEMKKEYAEVETEVNRLIKYVYIK